MRLAESEFSSGAKHRHGQRPSRERSDRVFESKLKKVAMHLAESEFSQMHITLLSQSLVQSKRLLKTMRGLTLL